MDNQATVKNDGEEHSLLEPPSIAYSSATVRRAFAVWMYCGQTNKFQHVCNYYHYLEALENTLPERCRAASQQHEINLFTSRPPLSPYLVNNFPTLYPAATQQITQRSLDTNKQNKIKKQNTNQKIQNTGTSKAEIVEASKMIRDYCKRSMKSLKVFLKEFKEYTQVCGLTNTVGNIAFYIKRKTITSEIELEANYARTLELMMRNYKDNEDVDKIYKEGETERTNDFNSLFLKKTNSLPATIDKKNSEIQKKSNEIINSKITEVNIDKNDYENKGKGNSNGTSYDIFDVCSYYYKHLKLRTIHFSDPNLIIREDFMKARKI